MQDIGSKKDLYIYIYICIVSFIYNNHVVLLFFSYTYIYMCVLRAHSIYLYDDERTPSLPLHVHKVSRRVKCIAAPAAQPAKPSSLHGCFFTWLLSPGWAIYCCSVGNLLLLLFFFKKEKRKKTYVDMKIRYIAWDHTYCTFTATVFISWLFFFLLLYSSFSGALACTSAISGRLTLDLETPLLSLLVARDTCL